MRPGASIPETLPTGASPLWSSGTSPGTVFTWLAGQATWRAWRNGPSAVVMAPGPCPCPCVEATGTSDFLHKHVFNKQIYFYKQIDLHGWFLLRINRNIIRSPSLAFMLAKDVDHPNKKSKTNINVKILSKEKNYERNFLSFNITIDRLSA